MQVQRTSKSVTLFAFAIRPFPSAADPQRYAAEARPPIGRHQ
jgi:hypothetical protein